MDLEKVHILAPAKINFSLLVEPPREDGLHPITSKMARITLFDDLELTRLDDHSLSRYAILWHDDAPKKADIDWPVTHDLAVLAHRALEGAVGRSLPLQMKLEKRIPIGGGLGGGSADAAAMLLGTSELFDLDVDLQEIAIGLGSDVPCLLNGGAGIVRGVGDVIEQVQHEETHLVLIIPEYSCSTAAVYESFDALGCQSKGVGNDLLLPACKVESNLQSDIEVLGALTDLEIHLSGSGSTMFIICDNEQRATELANEISQQTNHVAMATQTYMPQEAMERT